MISPFLLPSAFTLYTWKRGYFCKWDRSSMSAHRQWGSSRNQLVGKLPFPCVLRKFLNAESNFLDQKHSKSRDGKLIIDSMMVAQIDFT